MWEHCVYRRVYYRHSESVRKPLRDEVSVARAKLPDLVAILTIPTTLKL